jgi:signal transduction histidine kinase
MAHQAGMAEIAIGVMHNAGNILNSISVSSETIQYLLDKIPVNNLINSNNLFKELTETIPSFTLEPRTQLLLNYYEKLSDTIKTTKEKLYYETERLTENLTLIQELIETLQEHASTEKENSIWEQLEVTTAIEIAIKCQESFLKQNQVIVKKKYHYEQVLFISKAKLIHVLINIIKNAVESMQEVPVDSRILTIIVDKDENNKAVITISDTGIGITSEDLKKIFVFGFSTKEAGHGFGLHTCANYMKQLGSISVTSPGPNQGATFILVLNISGD